MITKEDFLAQYDGRNQRYSNFLVLNTTAEQVLDALNQIDPTMHADNCCIENDHVSFVIYKQHPSIIYDITKILHTIGYAATAWDYQEVSAARNGEEFEDYSIEWVDGEKPERDAFEDDDISDEEADDWMVGIVIIDDETGSEFYAGSGGLTYNEMLYYQELIDTQTI